MKYITNILFNSIQFIRQQHLHKVSNKRLVSTGENKHIIIIYKINEIYIKYIGTLIVIRNES